MRALSWTLMFIIVFIIGYAGTAFAVGYVMRDFKVETEPTYTQQLEVKPNYGTQNAQVYEEQPAINPMVVGDL